MKSGRHVDRMKVLLTRPIPGWTILADRYRADAIGRRDKEAAAGAGFLPGRAGHE